ncbi:DUF6894 family protein [Sphingomonas endolithica]|uniref:DUF6894 family protein n=1 Tax=Sphingomonas endolithica TaxID=2972485 RepID=UPI0021AEFA31|nr:hypothetical protein [Sphingomonas sp. ZFBP2030]
MARYFFHMQTDVRQTDNEGIEIAEPSEARRQAIQTCGEMMKEAPEVFWGSRPWNVTVTDATGRILWEIFMDGVSTPEVSN